MHFRWKLNATFVHHHNDTLVYIERVLMQQSSTCLGEWQVRHGTTIPQVGHVVHIYTRRACAYIYVHPHFLLLLVYISQKWTFYNQMLIGMAMCLYGKGNAQLEIE